MMFNPSVGVRIFDDVLLKFAAFMPPPTLPLPRETSSSSSSSSSNNSPTISIGIASTKSLTSISGKRIDASSFAFIVVDIVMMSSSSPSFPLSLVSVFLRKAHSAFRSHKIERKNLSLILSLSLIKINQNESFTRNSCYTNTASSALPRLIAFRGSHQHVCVKARESARNFLSCGELILFFRTLFFSFAFFFSKEKRDSLLCEESATTTQIISFDVSRPSSQRKPPRQEGRLITRTTILITTRKSSFSNHQHGLGRVSTRIGARRERHAKVFTETKQTERFERMRTQIESRKAGGNGEEIFAIEKG